MVPKKTRESLVRYMVFPYLERDWINITTAKPQHTPESQLAIHSRVSGVGVLNIFVSFSIYYGMDCIRTGGNGKYPSLRSTIRPDPEPTACADA